MALKVQKGNLESMESLYAHCGSHMYIYMIYCFFQGSRGGVGTKGERGEKGEKVSSNQALHGIVFINFIFPFRARKD